jgi:hypothetical protein
MLKTTQEGTLDLGYWKKSFGLKNHFHKKNIFIGTIIIFLIFLIFLILKYDLFTDEESVKSEEVKSEEVKSEEVKSEEVKTLKVMEFLTFKKTDYLGVKAVAKNFIDIESTLISNTPVTMEAEYITCDAENCKLRYKYGNTLLLKNNISSVSHDYDIDQKGVTLTQSSFLSTSNIQLDDIRSCSDTIF